MRKQQAGFVLIAALLIMVAIAILVFGTAFTSVIDRQISANQRGSADAYYLARAGLDKYKTVTFQAFRHYVNHLERYEDELKDKVTVCNNFLALGIDLDRDGVIDIDHQQFFPDLVFDQGTARVRFEVAGQYVILTSVGHAGRARATVQLVAQPRNAGPLGYAIFAGGGGFGNKKINANVQVFGGVYVEGSGSTIEPVIDANGNFAVHNYYTEQQLANLIQWNNRNVGPGDFLNLASLNQKDLCARLRVKNGFVTVSGNMNIGDPTTASTPSGYVANVAGVHVGANGDANEIRIQGNAVLHTDATSGFDLQDGVPFPNLDTTPCKDNPNLTLRQCLRATSSLQLIQGQVPAASGLDLSCAGDLTKPEVFDIVGGQPTLTFGSGRTQGNTYVLESADVRCFVRDVSGNVIGGFNYSYEPGPLRGTLDVFGVIDFRGYNLRFAQNVDVRFSEKATFFVELGGTGNTGGSVQIDGDILPDNRIANNTFPDQAVLGIMADRRVHITGRNQNRLETNGQAVAGVFYAGERAVVEGGTVFGSVIAPEFCSSENNANPPACRAGGNAAVVHIPGLEQNLAPGFDLIPPRPTFRVASFERR